MLNEVKFLDSYMTIIINKSWWKNRQ